MENLNPVLLLLARLFVVIFMAPIVLVVLGSIDGAAGEWKYSKLPIRSKEYIPEVIKWKKKKDPDGDYITTKEVIPEEYTIQFQLYEGFTGERSIKVSPQQYASFGVGQKVDIKIREGRFTNFYYWINLAD